MAAFLYVAVDAGGRERKGVLEGDTARHVRQLLREQALLPVSVTEVVGEQKQAATAGGGSAPRFTFKFQRGLSAADLSLVTRQLATLVKSSLPLEEALLAVSQQTDKPKVRNTLLFYDDAYQSLIRDGDPVRFRDFLLRAGRTSMARSMTVSSPFNTGLAAAVSFNAP